MKGSSPCMCACVRVDVCVCVLVSVCMCVHSACVCVCVCVHVVLNHIFLASLSTYISKISSKRVISARRSLGTNLIQKKKKVVHPEPKEAWFFESALIS